MKRVSQALSHVPAGRTLLVATATLFAFRLVVSLVRTGPVIMADEAGYLLNARALAGGMPAEMGSSPFYRGGYSLVIAPLLSGHSDPALGYHGVLVVNAALAAGLVPLLYLLLTRCFDTAPQAAAWAAIAGAAYPSITAMSEVALSENALSVLTVVWLLSIGFLLRGRNSAPASIGWALATGASAAALWTAHGRMLVAVAVTATVLAALVIRRALSLAVGAAGAAVLAGGIVAGRVLNDWLVTTNYRGRRADDVDAALSSLDDVHGVLAALRNLVGASWYLIVATLGIALVLLVCDVPGAVARIRRRRGEPADHLLGLLLVTTAGLLAVSAAWFVTSTRPDQLIYGRYVEPVVPALVAVGVVALSRVHRIPRTLHLVGVVTVLTLLVAVLRANLDVSVEASRWNIASLPSVTGQLEAPVLLLAGVVASAALSALLLVRRRAPAALAPLMVLLFVPTTVYTVYLPVLKSEADVYPAGWTSPRPIVERRHVDSVAYDLDRFDHVAVKVYQWFLPHTRVVLFHGRAGAPPTALFFSGRRLSGELAKLRAVRLWIDPGRDQALWQVVGPRE